MLGKLFKKRGSDNSGIERYSNFHIQIKYDCKGKYHIVFVELVTPVSREFVDYFRPFGDVIPVSENFFEISRKDFFKISICIDRTSFQVEFPENYFPEAKDLLIKQIDLALNNNFPVNYSKICPVNAIEIEDDTVKYDRKKCDFCLECVKIL